MVLRKYRVAVDGISCHPWSHPLRLEDPIRWFHGYTRVLRRAGFEREMGAMARVPPRWLQRALWLALAVINSTRKASWAVRSGRRSLGGGLADALRMVNLACRENINPFFYYTHDLDDPVHRRFPAGQLSDWEFGLIQRESSRWRRHDVGMLARKDRFARFCQEHGLPAPRCWMPAEWSAQTDFPNLTLFIKPSLLYGGRGCLRLERGRAGEWIFEDRHLAGNRIVPTLRAHFGHDDFVLQENLSNAADLLELSPHCLGTVRVYSGRMPDGEVRAFRAYLRMGTGRAVVDNYSRGGLMSELDVVSGELFPARSWTDRRPRERHPETGAVIAGRVLPGWRAARDLVRRAHRAADDFNLLGWDVALTPEGPCLIECNVWSQIVGFRVGLLEDPAFLACLFAEIRLIEAARAQDPVEGPAALVRSEIPAPGICLSSRPLVRMD